MTEEMKRCSKCGEVKPVSEFTRNRRTKDGLKTECKACRGERARKWYEQHRRDVLEHQRKYNEAHSDKRAKYRACVRHPSCPLVGQKGAEFVIFTCEVCGKEFRRRKADVDWKYEREGRLPRFCSRECYFASMRKGYKSPYARKIEEIRKRVKA